LAEAVQVPSEAILREEMAEILYSTELLQQVVVVVVVIV
jgi:hypothetical protein